MLNDLHHLAFIGPGGPEIIVVMLVLLLLFGAKDAPRMLRKLNDMLNQLRSTAENFKREVMYSDLQDEPTPDRAEGEYDDYGVNYEMHHGDDESGAGTESVDDMPPAADSDVMPLEGEEEGGDVQKN